MPRFLDIDYLSEAVNSQSSNMNSMLLTEPHHLQKIDRNEHRGFVPDSAFRKPWIRDKPYCCDMRSKNISDAHEELKQSNGISEIESYHRICDAAEHRTAWLEVVPSSNPDSQTSIDDELLAAMVQQYDSYYGVETFPKETKFMTDHEDNEKLLEEPLFTDYYKDCLDNIPKTETSKKRLQFKVVQDPFVHARRDEITHETVFRQDLIPDVDQTCADDRGDKNSFEEEFTHEAINVDTSDEMKEELELAHRDITHNVTDQLVPTSGKHKKILVLEEEFLEDNFVISEDQKNLSEGCSLPVDHMEAISPLNDTEEDKSFVECNNQEVSDVIQKAVIESPALTHQNVTKTYKQPLKQLSCIDTSSAVDGLIASRTEQKQTTKMIWKADKSFSDVLTLKSPDQKNLSQGCSLPVKAVSPLNDKEEDKSFVECNNQEVSDVIKKAVHESPAVTHQNVTETYKQPLKQLSCIDTSSAVDGLIASRTEQKQTTKMIWKADKSFSDVLTLKSPAADQKNLSQGCSLPVKAVSPLNDKEEDKSFVECNNQEVSDVIKKAVHESPAVTHQNVTKTYKQPLKQLCCIDTSSAVARLIVSRTEQKQAMKLIWQADKSFSDVLTLKSPETFKMKSYMYCPSVPNLIKPLSLEVLYWDCCMELELSWDLLPPSILEAMQPQKQLLRWPGAGRVSFQNFRETYSKFMLKEKEIGTRKKAAKPVATVSNSSSNPAPKIDEKAPKHKLVELTEVDETMPFNKPVELFRIDETMAENKLVELAEVDERVPENKPIELSKIDETVPNNKLVELSEIAETVPENKPVELSKIDETVPKNKLVELSEIAETLANSKRPRQENKNFPGQANMEFHIDNFLMLITGEPLNAKSTVENYIERRQREKKSEVSKEEANNVISAEMSRSANKEAIEKASEMYRKLEMKQNEIRTQKTPTKPVRTVLKSSSNPAPKIDETAPKDKLVELSEVDETMPKHKFVQMSKRVETVSINKPVELSRIDESVAENKLIELSEMDETAQKNEPVGLSKIDKIVLRNRMVELSETVPKNKPVELSKMHETVPKHKLVELSEMDETLAKSKRPRLEPKKISDQPNMEFHVDNFFMVTTGEPLKTKSTVENYTERTQTEEMRDVSKEEANVIAAEMSRCNNKEAIERASEIYKKLEMKQNEKIATSPRQSQHPQLVAIGSQNVTCQQDLLKLLEKRYNMTLYERHYAGITYADIILDEQECIILEDAAKIHEDIHIEALTERLLGLGLQFTRCWILLVTSLDPGSHQYSYNTNTVKTLARVQGIIHAVQRLVENFQIKVLHCGSLVETGAIIRRISDTHSTTVQTDYPGNTCLTASITKHEKFLIAIPCMNSFSAQMLLSAGSMKSLVTKNYTQMVEAFPWIPKHIIENFVMYMNLDQSLQLQESERADLKPSSTHSPYNLPTMFHDGVDTAEPYTDLGHDSDPGDEILDTLEIIPSQSGPNEFEKSVRDSLENRNYYSSRETSVTGVTLADEGFNTEESTSWQTTDHNIDADWRNASEPRQAFLHNDANTRMPDRWMPFPEETGTQFDDIRHGTQLDFPTNARNSLFSSSRSIDLPTHEDLGNQKYRSYPNRKHAKLWTEFDDRSSSKSFAHYSMDRRYASKSPVAPVAPIVRKPPDHHQSGHTESLIRRSHATWPSCNGDSPPMDLGSLGWSLLSPKQRTRYAHRGDFNVLQEQHTKKKVLMTPNKRRRLTYEKIPGQKGQTRLNFV